jgi:spore coat protein U-like protein
MLTMTVSGARATRFLLTACVLLAPAAASASQVGSTLTVEADVVANCTVSVGTVDFGDINPLAGVNINGSGTFNVTCTSGTTWTAAAGVGSGPSASYTTRKMSFGSNTLNYNLYTTSGYGTVWGDGTGGTGLLSGTGNGSAQTATVYGRIASGQTTAPPGGYADSVSITVTY